VAISDAAIRLQDEPDRQISSFRRSFEYGVAAYPRFTVDPTGAGDDDGQGTRRDPRRRIELELLVVVVAGLAVLAVIAHW
jgi:hypothetical protein